MRKSNAKQIAELLMAVRTIYRREWRLPGDAIRAREMAQQALDLAGAARAQLTLCLSMASEASRLADKVSEKCRLHDKVSAGG